MSKSTKEPITLGDKLQNQGETRLPELFIVIFVPALWGVAAWWLSQSIVSGVLTLIICALFLIVILFTKEEKEHFLTLVDRNGFMKSLKLADKTVLFDGSNIYHFGLEHGVGTKALNSLVQRLREDGYRIICFFDANIYFTLRDNGEFQNRRESFSPAILQRLFELNANEIYVVPSRLQADLFIVETLSLLPKSFAVTNDRFRDYAAEFDILAEDPKWRKGVKIQKGVLLLTHYHFKPALKI